MATEIILGYLTAYHLVAVFIGAFFFGETVVLLAFFLTSQGLLSPITVFCTALVGTVASDSLWFWLGRQNNRLEKKSKLYTNRFERIHRIVSSYAYTPERVLLFIKFFYGTRVVAILYLGAIGTPFYSFLVYNIIGTTFWLLVLLILGSLLGFGYATIPALYHSIEYIALFAVILIISIKIIVWKKNSRRNG